jgi:hypothetical protein
MIWGSLHHLQIQPWANRKSANKLYVRRCRFKISLPLNPNDMFRHIFKGIVMTNDNQLPKCFEITNRFS